MKQQHVTNATLQHPHHNAMTLESSHVTLRAWLPRHATMMGVWPAVVCLPRRSVMYLTMVAELAGPLYFLAIHIQQQKGDRIIH